MKVLRGVTVVLIVLAVLLSATACKDATAAGGSYELYTFDMSANRFVRLGYELACDKNKGTFTLNLLNTVFFYGSMERRAMGYTLVIDSDVYLQSQAALSDLTDEQEDALSAESLAAWQSALRVSEQVYFYGDCAFSANSIDLVRRVDGTERTTYTSVEGYYESASDAANIYLFRNGYVYGNLKDDDGNPTYDDEGNPKTSTIPNASYLLNNGFIVLTRLDATGKVLMDEDDNPRQIVYLLAGITYPKDSAEFGLGNSEEDQALKALAEKLAGKTVGVLTKTFYSSKDLTQYVFN